MVNPELTGALDGLRILQAGDLPGYKRAVDAGQQVGWAYYFPYLLSRNRSGRSAVLLAEDDDSVCVYGWRMKDGKPRLDLLLAPAPMNGLVLARCLQRANDFNGDFSARVMRIDEKDAEAASAVPYFQVGVRKKQYLYAPTSFADLGGRRYRTLRRYVARIEEMPGLEVVPFSAAHREACDSLLAQWGAQHREAHGTAGGMGTSTRALELTETFSEPDLRGEVVFIDGRLVAFALGGEIRPGVGCFFEAKSDSGVQGLAYFQRYSFLSKLSEFEFVNDGSDAGRPGLKQLKDSLRPAEMHVEYRGTQRRHTGGAS